MCVRARSVGVGVFPKLVLELATEGLGTSMKMHIFPSAQRQAQLQRKTGSVYSALPQGKTHEGGDYSTTLIQKCQKEVHTVLTPQVRTPYCMQLIHSCNLPELAHPSLISRSSPSFILSKQR